MGNNSGMKLIEAVFSNKSRIQVHDIMELIEMAGYLPENIILEVDLS